MMKVLGRRVLVRRAEITDSYRGIIIPEKSRAWPQEGTVVAVGDAVDSVKPGDRVVFGRDAGTQVTVDDAVQVQLWERDCMGILGDA